MNASFSRPIPRILWYRNQVLIADSGDHFQLKVYNRTLRLGSLSSASHDGTYKCVADSGNLRVEKSFSIKVIGMAPGGRCTKRYFIGGRGGLCVDVQTFFLFIHEHVYFFFTLIVWQYKILQVLTGRRTLNRNHFPH